MTLCIICRSQEAAPHPGLCARCAGVLSADGQATATVSFAPDRLIEEILTELRERVARSVGGLPFERELSHDEVDALLQSFPE
ncbi:MAG: hypothetical protein IPL62_20895 [Caulobacteraceae bacterium]|nr:hypothetical protein [Caulobacteraceae bacterium]